MKFRKGFQKRWVFAKAQMMMKAPRISIEYAKTQTVVKTLLSFTGSS